MDDIKPRLIGCFEIVFPGLSPDEIPNATQSGVAAWDSVAAITLVNLIEEEFNIQMDFDLLADLTSFDLILKYLAGLLTAC